MSIINTNIASLNAQRNLTKSQDSLGSALQRLSSGLRINSAKDDAAGLAIATRFSTQISGMNQAARNANDGISLSQTAEGALDQVTNNLQRIRDLAVQAANATNSATDRAALNSEASQLIAEIDRVATSSSFNGVKLLDGTFTAQTFQVGADSNADNRISITSISSARSASLGVGSGSSYSTSITNPTAVTTGVFVAGDVTINGYQVGASTADGVSFSGNTSSAIAKAAAINAITGSTSVTATVDAQVLAGAAASGFAVALLSDDVRINGVNIGAISAGASALDRGGDVAAAVNAVSSQTGVTATFDTATGAVALNAADGRNISVALNGKATALTQANTGITSGAGGTTVGTYTTTTTTSSINLSSTSSAGITIGGNNEAFAGLTAGYTAATSTAGAGVSSLDLTTFTGALAALTTLDSALATVNSSRASLGAYQNRFASTVANLQTSSENLSASRSRIRDADFAAETANLTRAQILQQAGTAMLAQANALPQGVLALLR